ncbi:MAG: phosphoribosylaminoimidazolesuccinocarboxamide synthase [Thermoplasmata archaeon]|nr:phosphoribosylaminoimidazolesuccinocarboxamide synthase [Thermoplasmata archaeon]
MRVLRRGKVKDVYEVDDETLEFLFSDRISVFDKIIPSEIPNKGETLCRTSAYWFKAMESMGVKSHFLDLSAGNRMRVKRLQILDKPDGDSRNCMIPLEFVSRNYVAGSLLDRLKSGVVDPKVVGLTKDKVAYGQELPRPFVEVTTKFEEFDRPLDIEEALEISGLTGDEFKEVEEIVLRVDDRINSEVRKRGLIHVDGKKEFGLDNDRNIMMVDSFGTADEDRFWDLGRFEEGECVELSKEFVRQYYRNIKYYDEITLARREGLKEPDIPPLPDETVKEVSNLYVDMFEKITGEVFE